MVESEQKSEIIGGTLIQGSKPDKYGRVRVREGMSIADVAAGRRSEENKKTAAEVGGVTQEAKIVAKKPSFREWLSRGWRGLIRQ